MTEQEMLELEKYWCENCCNFDKEHIQMDGQAKCKLTGTLAYCEESGKDCKCFNVPAEKGDLEHVLMAVMHSVDKWLEGDELKHNEATRAAIMREKTLQIIEKEQAKVKKLQEELEIKSQKRANIFEISDAFARGESKGRKEFADRLREKITDVVPFMRTPNEYVEYTITVGAAFRHIQNLLEEMEGEGK